MVNAPIIFIHLHSVPRDRYSVLLFGFWLLIHMLVVPKVGSFVVPYWSVDYFDVLTEMLHFATCDLVFADGFSIFGHSLSNP